MAGMNSRARSILVASLTMVGTIIGAGIFGLPAAFSAVGFWPGTALFWVLAGAAMTTHLLFAGMLLQENRRMRLTGLVRRHLDPFFHIVAEITYPLQVVASIFAYLILGGEFLSILARAAGISLPVGIWQMVFWLVGGVTVLFGLKAVARVNGLATSAKMATLLLAVVVAWPLVDLASVRLHGWGEWFLPFGIFLYALSGLPAVGETVEITKRNKREALWAVGIGSFVSALLSWMFGVVIYLAARGYPIHTISEVVSVLPSGWALLIPFLGLLSVSTAYLIMAEDLKETLDLDFKLNAKQSVAIALGLPLLLLLAVSRDFLATIGFIGSVFVSLNGLMICAMAFKSFERQRRASTRLLGLFVIVLLAAVYLFGLFQRILFRETL
jgi:tyrosine-specific transport protein